MQDGRATPHLLYPKQVSSGAFEYIPTSLTLRCAPSMFRISRYGIYNTLFFISRNYDNTRKLGHQTHYNVIDK